MRFAVLSLLHLSPLLSFHVFHQTGGDEDDAHHEDDGGADEGREKSETKALVLQPRPSWRNTRDEGNRGSAPFISSSKILRCAHPTHHK